MGIVQYAHDNVCQKADISCSLANVFGHESLEFFFHNHFTVVLTSFFVPGHFGVVLTSAVVLA